MQPRCRTLGLNPTWLGHGRMKQALLILCYINSTQKKNFNFHMQSLCFFFFVVYRKLYTTNKLQHICWHIFFFFVDFLHRRLIFWFSARRGTEKMLTLSQLFVRYKVPALCDAMLARFLSNYRKDGENYRKIRDTYREITSCTVSKLVWRSNKGRR